MKAYRSYMGASSFGNMYWAGQETALIILIALTLNGECKVLEKLKNIHNTKVGQNLFQSGLNV